MYKQFVPAIIGQCLFNSLYNDLNWANPGMPRYTYFMSRCKCPYDYSRHSIEPAPWHQQLQILIQHVCNALNLNDDYDCANLNLYQGSHHSVEWHADDEDRIGVDPTILSISLGSARKFVLRTNQQPYQYDSFLLEDLDVCVMSGNLQATHQHKVPKVWPPDPKSVRINITARVTKKCTCGKLHNTHPPLFKLDPHYFSRASSS